MLRYCLTLAATLLLLARAPALADDAPDPNAMTFSAWTGTEGAFFGQGNRSYIFADGDVVAGTPDAFKQFLQQNPIKAPNTTVVLNSPGGDLGAGLELGQLIRDNKLWTEVGSRLPINIGVSPSVPAKMVPYLARPVSPPFPGACYSSCTFAFLGGIVRSVGYSSIYGVHRFAFEGSTAGIDLADQAQQMSGQLVAYVDAMGIAPEFITEMSTKGPSEINDLSVQRLADLNVITPRWRTTWQIATLPNNSGFYLQGTTIDPWGTHEIAVTCPPPTVLQVPPGAAQNVPNATALQLTFFVDPGGRADVTTLANAVESYALELDQGTATIPGDAVAGKASVSSASKRLSASINVPGDMFTEISQSAHLGFAFIFKANATPKLPLRVLQFESTLNAAQLKNFRGTCH